MNRELSALSGIKNLGQKIRKGYCLYGHCKRCYSFQRLGITIGLRKCFIALLETYKLWLAWLLQALM